MVAIFSIFTAVTRRGVAVCSIFTALTRRGINGRYLQYFHCFD